MKHDTPAPATAARDSVDVSGRSRTFTAVGAAGGAPGRALVLVFHGSRQSGDTHRSFTGNAFDELAGTGAAVVAYLDGYRGNWNDARRASWFPARKDNIDDIGFTRAVIHKLAATHRIDPRWVFAVGYSNGGQMVMRLAHEAPELISGAAVLAATMPAPENFLAGDAPPAPMPVLLVHGTKDPIVNYTGGGMKWWKRRLFKVGGRSLPVPETARYFAARNGITTEPVTTALPTRDGSADPTKVERTDYRQDGHPPVVLYSIHGGGHTIPGPAKAPAILGKTNHDLNTAETIGTFFKITR